MGIEKPEHLDCVIIGAGPAGLAGAVRCQSEGLRFLVVEAGPPVSQRSIDNPDTSAFGIGGAGLYSDGKLSFFPAAHCLWSLPNQTALEKAYSWLMSLCSDLSSSFPPYPTPALPAEWFEVHASTSFEKKPYESIVLSNADRKVLLDRLLAPIAHRIMSHCPVIGIERTGSGFLVKCLEAGENTISLDTSTILYAAGRFGPLDLGSVLPDLQAVFRRFECGVRIEQKSDEFFLKDDNMVDTKLILQHQSPGIEWRTFCACRRGHVIGCRWKSLKSFSGLSSCDSESSNIGFNIRLSSLDAYRLYEQEAVALTSGMVKPFSMPLATFLDEKSSSAYLGLGLDTLLREGLRKLFVQYRLEGALLHGPCYEGTGLYPALRANLEASEDGFFIAGDSTGLFRGLLAAFLSGFCAASEISQRLKSRSDLMSRDVSVKSSSLSPMTTIFTAQSKRFFYCRDAICEFVLREGKLPVNPFRVFDYFLGDRVERDIVRQGNNHLIRLCDEMWVFGQIADGVLFEIAYASAIGKPVRFFTVGTKVVEIVPISELSDISFEPEVHSSQETGRQTREQLLSLVRGLFLNSRAQMQGDLFELQ